jgi:hypothetical protein
MAFSRIAHILLVLLLYFPQITGFREFMIEKFATNCCLYSVLDKSFDLRDANSVRHACNCLMWQSLYLQW